MENDLPSGSGLFGDLSGAPNPPNLFSAPQIRKGLFGIPLTSETSASSSTVGTEPRFEIENATPLFSDSQAPHKISRTVADTPLVSNIQPNLFSGLDDAQNTNPSSNPFADFKSVVPGAVNLFAMPTVHESGVTPGNLENRTVLFTEPRTYELRPTIPAPNLFTGLKPPNTGVSSMHLRDSPAFRPTRSLLKSLKPPDLGGVNTQTSVLIKPKMSKTPLQHQQQLFSGLLKPNQPGLFSNEIFVNGTSPPHLFRKSNYTASNLSSPPKTAGGSCQPDLITAVKISRIPAGVNQKTQLAKLFGRFGKIERIICQPTLDTAMIAFSSLVETQRAKTDAAKLIPGVITSISRCVRRQITQMISSVSSPRLSPSASSPNLFKLAPAREPPSLQDRPHPAQPLSASPSPSSGRSAFTVEERLVTLEARDRAEHAKRQAEGGRLRPGGKRQAKPAVGTCPDMCPETERYLRELRQRVSIFECLNSEASSALWQMDHTRAVKDYSRSAADQAETLPWELRPPSVLGRTMAYLLAAVADRPEIDQTRNLWKPWYEFLWTRTRAIRKDITQQRLCSLTVVSIIEKITRFHIWCAARLVDQSMDAFDPRINSENLTQCLQTLKELYCDLNSSGSECPREPEFRAYMILMTLNDSSVLNEVQRFPDALRKTKQVQFAIAMHSAVAERNHVRFFRLVRMADCLSACLLHRYFNQVRSHALLALSAAFAGHPKRAVGFSLTTLMHRLAFESLGDARDFCQHWGLYVDDHDVVFQRQSPPRVPELAWHERRARLLIEGKRTGQTLADLFNGGPVDHAADGTPAPVLSSFSPAGHLLSIPEIVNQSEERTDSSSSKIRAFIEPPKVALPVSKTSAPFAPHDAKLAQTKYAEELKQSTLKEMFNELVDEESRRVPCKVITEEISLLETMENLVENEVTLHVKQIATEAIGIQAVLTAIDDITEDLVSRCLATFIPSIATASLCETMATALISDLVDESLRDLVVETVREVHADIAHHLRLQRRCFGAWRTVVTLCRSADARRSLEAASRLLLRRMPASPSNAIWLGGACVERAVEARRACRARRTPSHTQDTHWLKRCRLSAEAESIDFDLAWRPMEPIIGLELPASDSSVALVFPPPPPSSLLVNWTLAKLAPTPAFRLVSPPLTTLSETHAVILVDCVVPPTSIAGLPRLYLASSPGPPTDVGPKVSWLVFPPYEGDPHLLVHTWSGLLRSGLEWLATEMGSSRPVKEEEDREASGGASGRQERLTLRSREILLIDVLQRHVETAFFTPLFEWMKEWKEQGLTHPDPHHILRAYNQSLQPLNSHIPSTAFLTSLPPPFTINTTSEDGEKAWSSFASTYDNPFVEDEFGRVKLASHRLALLVPWGLICVRFLHNHLEMLRGDLKAVSAPPQLRMGSILDRPLEFDWGPQYSVAAVEDRTVFLTSRPLIATTSSEDARGRRKRDLLQELRELETRVERVSGEARSLIMD